MRDFRRRCGRNSSEHVARGWHGDCSRTGAMRLAWIVIVLAAGCDSSPFDPSLDDATAITQGVYGQIVEVCDGCRPEDKAGINVALFQQHVPSLGNTGQPLTYTTTNTHGFYQLWAAIGEYTLCPGTVLPDESFAVEWTCSSIVVTPHMKQRRDLELDGWRAKWF
jgi:hypothetical protein